MSKFVANCVVMGVKSKPSQDGSRTYRTAMLYFEDDTTSLEASISDEQEHLYTLIAANKMKPCHLTVNLREYKGQRFINVTGYAPTGAVSLHVAGGNGSSGSRRLGVLSRGAFSGRLCAWCDRES